MSVSSLGGPMLSGLVGPTLRSRRQLPGAAKQGHWQVLGSGPSVALQGPAADGGFAERRPDWWAQACTNLSEDVWSFIAPMFLHEVKEQLISAPGGM